MDMRTRIERKMDKLMTVKRKNWEIELKMKVPEEEWLTGDWNRKERTDSDTTPNPSEAQTRVSKKAKTLSKPKRKPMIKMSKRKETQTLLRRNVEFQLIGSGRPSLKADSAGHKLDICYQIRTEQRIKIVNALTTDAIPAGALMPMSVAIRVESAIFRVLNQDTKDYLKYCDICSTYIAQKRNQYVRLNLLMGHLDAEEFAFIPSVSTEFEDMIEMRIKWKNAEEKEKIKQLRKGIV